MSARWERYSGLCRIAGGLSLVIGLLAAVPAYAAGLICAQTCGAEGCEQATCVAASQEAGYCTCRAGALPWGEGGYAAWCRASGKPAPACPVPQPAEDNAGRPIDPPPAQVLAPDDLTAVLAVRNPFVAALLAAMQDDGQWASGPVEGLVHPSRLDEATGAVAHGRAFHFSGQVVAGGIDAAEVTMTIAVEPGPPLSPVAGPSPSSTVHERKYF